MKRTRRAGAIADHYSGFRQYLRPLFFGLATAAVFLAPDAWARRPEAFTHHDIRVLDAPVHADALSGRQLSDFCQSLLTRYEPPSSVRVLDVPGLYVLRDSNHFRDMTLLQLQPKSSRDNEDGFYRHELQSTAVYAQYLQSSHNESVMLVPGMNHIDFPAFDGVIYNSDGDAVANYSLKTILDSRSGMHVYRRAREGIDKARIYAHLRSWLNMVGPLETDNRGHVRIVGQSAKRANIWSRWLAASIRLFGVGSNPNQIRPTRVVVDLQSAPLPDQFHLDQLERIVRRSRGVIENVTLLKDGNTIILK